MVISKIYNKIKKLFYKLLHTVYIQRKWWWGARKQYESKWRNKRK